jgi:branched-chain amino acid transport system substrate-binding protein
VLKLKVRITIAAIALSALVAAGCGSSKSSSSSTSAAAPAGGVTSSKCAVSVGFEGPITGPAASLGDEQLAFAKLAVADDNKANGTSITLVQGDTQLTPALATTVTQQFISNSKIVAVVGPAGSQEVKAVGPLFGRAGMAFVSPSATNPTLTSSGRNPTFFRVVDLDNRQGPEDAHFVLNKLHPKAVMIVDDQEVYSTGLVSSMIPVFKAAGISVDHESVSQKVTDFSSLVAKVTPQTTVVVLPWQLPPNAEQFGKNLQEQHKKATIVGTDGTDAPGTFTIPGSYVSTFGPDITAIPSDASLVTEAKAAFPKFGTFGPPTYAATHVVDQAIASVCKSGTPSRSSVLSAVKATNEPSSVLGQPIKFDSHGDLINAKWFLFNINAQGKYNLVTGA